MRVCSAGILAVVLCARLASAEIVFFTSPPAFTLECLQRGAALSATETFEEAELVGGKVPFPDPLQSGISNDPVFPSGLAAPGLLIQTNRLQGPLAPRDVPSGNAQALFAVAAGAIGTNSVKVGEDLGILFGIECSIDIVFTADNIHAIGLELSRFQGFGTAGWHIGVFDADDVLIGHHVLSGPVAAEPAKNFFGMWSATPIARINLFDLSANPAPDAVDNIQMWVPAPGAFVMFGALSICAARRRHRS